MSSANKNGTTALIYAVQERYTEVVKILIAGGAEVNQKNKRGFTAFDAAKHNGFSEIIRILRAAGAK